MPRITDFCSCIYVLRCKLSVVRLCNSDFGITAVDDITIGITCAAFCLHIAHISFDSTYYYYYYYYYVTIAALTSSLESGGELQTEGTLYSSP